MSPFFVMNTLNEYIKLKLKTMSKLNPVKKTTSRFSATEKLAGGHGLSAAKQDAESQLRRAVMACLLWENNFYEDGVSGTDNIKALIPKVDPAVVAEIAKEARHEQKLRHIPLFIAMEMLKHATHRAYVADVLESVILRPDQMTDALAIYWKDQANAPLAKQLKKGLAKAFLKFDEYALAKYNRDAAIKLVDVANLVHPKPVDNRQVELFAKLMKGELKTPDTWEIALSSGADKKATWTRLITEKKLGGLAFLRNLRNMKDAGVDHNVIRTGLSNLKSSFLLPLNFYGAVQHAPEFKAEIEAAMLNCYANLPKIPGHSIFVVDVSGSMGSGISGKSNFTRQQVANIMAMLAMNQCESVDIYLSAGSDGARTHKTMKLAYPAKGFGLLEQIEKETRSLGGGGIFTRQALEFIEKETTTQPDRIIVFSDSQDMDGRNTVPKPFGVRNYIVDVSAHKNGINFKNVWTAEVSGWSEHFLTYIAALEGVSNNFVDDTL